MAMKDEDAGMGVLCHNPWGWQRDLLCLWQVQRRGNKALTLSSCLQRVLPLDLPGGENASGTCVSTVRGSCSKRLQLLGLMWDNAPSQLLNSLCGKGGIHCSPNPSAGWPGWENCGLLVHSRLGG